MSVQLDTIEKLITRLNNVLSALPGTPEKPLIEDQLSHGIRRLQGHCQKPLTSGRQLILIRHDLAATAYWLTFLVNNDHITASRLIPLQKDIATLLTDLKTEGSAKMSPKAIPQSPEPVTQPIISSPSISVPHQPPPPQLDNWMPEDSAHIPATPPNLTKPKSPKSAYTKIEFEGQTYSWTGANWFDEHYLKPPEIILTQLNRQLDSTLALEDKELTDIHELIERAHNARNTMQFSRAERLSRRILELEPNSHAGATMLCSALRARHLPEKAISETDRFARTGNPALLTSRAAAFCDLAQWEEAHRLVSQSLAIQASEEAFMVVKRIKAERPELYRK